MTPDRPTLDAPTLPPIKDGSHADLDADDPGKAGRWDIGERLGSGGCGTVYLATHDATGQRAAVKVLHRHLSSDPRAVERFLREVRVVDAIKHPSIVAIFDLGTLSDGRPYFAMELLEGQNLRRLLQQQGRLSPVEAHEILEQIAGALGAAHAAGLVHRDVKLENVILARGRSLRLVDFGIAKLLEPDPSQPGLTSTHQMLGTLASIAPEQILFRPVDPRTDIYALGVLLYNLLTGDYPFRGSQEELLRMHLESTPPPPSALTPLSPAIDAVVLRCLEKEPAARFPDVAAALAAFRTAVFGDATATDARTGIGVLVHAAAADEDDEDALADAADALDAAESRLAGAGYTIAVRTSIEVLGVRVADGDLDERRRASIALARELHESLRGGATIRVSITVHVDQVQLRGEGEIAGGPLLEIGAWVGPGAGLHVTARAGAGIT